jgi:hypothetical protein
MQPKLLVQSLTGLKAQILWAFFFAMKAMDIEELMTWTSKPRVSHYGPLKALCGAGLLARQTMAHGRELFLLGTEVLPLMQDLAGFLGGGKYLEAIQISVFQTPGAMAVIDAVSRTPEEMDALERALADHRIISPTKEKLVAREWVTADYVRSMVEFEKGERQPEHAVGRAIKMMLAHVPQPARRANGHIQNCACTKCKVDDALGMTKWGICADCHQAPCVCEDEIIEEDLEEEIE